MSEPIVVTIKIPADFDRALTFTVTPHRPDPDDEPLPLNSPAPEGDPA